MTSYRIPEAVTSRAKPHRAVSDAASHYGRRNPTSDQVQSQNRRADVRAGLAKTDITDDARGPQAGIARTVTRERVSHVLAKDTTVPGEDLKGLSSITYNKPQDRGVAGTYHPDTHEIQTAHGPARPNEYIESDERRMRLHAKDRAQYGNLLTHEVGHHVDETHGGLDTLHTGEVEARAENYAGHHAPHPASPYDNLARVNSPLAPWNKKGAAGSAVAGISGNDRYKAERASGNLPGRDEPVMGRANKTYTPEEQAAQFENVFNARKNFKPLPPNA